MKLTIEKSSSSAIKGCHYSGDTKKRIYSEEEIEERAMTKKKKKYNDNER